MLQRHEMVFFIVNCAKEQANVLSIRYLIFKNFYDGVTIQFWKVYAVQY
jgi:hypothetical protein